MSIEAIRELETLASVCPELNMANCTEDDVRHLNDWAIEMSLLVERYTLSQQTDNAACKSVQKRLAAQQSATAIACGIPGMVKTTCPYCEQGFAFEHEQPATGEPVKSFAELREKHRAGIEAERAKLDATTEPVAWLDEMLADTREVFDAGGSETPQVVRDVIEYVKSWVTVYSEKNHPAPAAQPAPSEPATTEPVVSCNPFASRCYTMSESHLSGHRLIVGFEKLGDAQDAYEWVTRQGRGDFTHPAPSVPGDMVRDAERYQWLRKWKGQEHEPPFTVQHEFDGTIWGGDLDSAIDAAMLTSAQAKKEKP